MINEAAAGKVLIVDDEGLNVEVLSQLLRHDGYEVISAANGALALDAVGREHPDVVLMDPICLASAAWRRAVSSKAIPPRGSCR